VTSDTSLKALLMLRAGGDAQVGESRIALLRAIAETGSIAAAAKQAGLSYKGAWDAVQALNNLSARPLVTAHSGGASGGAALVTAQGQALMRAYDGLVAALDAQMVRLGAALNDGDAMSDLLGSLTMRTTARNAWRGAITAVDAGPVSAEVVLKVSDSLSLTAVVTRESVETLGLAAGKSAVALVKSSFVVLAAGHDSLPVSARNRIMGVISAVTPGAVNDEVVLDAGGGKTVTAVVTHESCERLDFRVGGKAQALIKASHIILAVD